MRTTWWFRTAVAAMAAGVVFAAAPLPASAQAPVSAAAKALARKNYKAAETKYAQGAYAEALGLYEQAEATIPVPQTKYKIASCHDKLGHAAEAARWYQTFLDAVPPDKADKLADAIADARGRLAAIRSAPGSVRLVYSPPSARVVVSIDGGARQLASPTLTLPPGHHRLSFSADGFDPQTSEVDVGPAEVKDVRFSLNASRGAAVAVVPPPPPVVVPPPLVGAPPPPAAPPPPPPRRSNVPAYVLMGVGGAGLIVGAAFGGIALQDKSNFNAHPTNDGANTTHTHALISDVSFAAGGGVAIVGIILLVTNLPHRQSDSALNALRFVAPYAGPNGAGATAGLSF
jgi:hypothetical protein